MGDIDLHYSDPGPAAATLPFRPIRGVIDRGPRAYWRASCAACGAFEPVAAPAPMLRCTCGHAPVLVACWGQPHFPAAPKILPA